MSIARGYKYYESLINTSMKTGTIQKSQCMLIYTAHHSLNTGKP